MARTANAAKSLAFSSLLDAVTAIPPLAYLITFVGFGATGIPTMLVALTDFPHFTND